MRIDWPDFITGGGALFLALGVICIAGSVYTLSHGADQDSWSQTRGTITRSRLESAPPGSQATTRKIFAYEYEVQGQTYRSDRYSFGSVAGDRTVGIRRFRRGDAVIVHYDPRDPSVAVLEKRQPGVFVYVVLLFGLLFLQASAGCLLARDFTALFSRAGAKQLWKELTAEEPANESAGPSKVAESPATLVDQLRAGLETERFDLERVAQFIRGATGVDMETARKLAGDIAAGRHVDLAAVRKT